MKNLGGYLARRSNNKTEVSEGMEMSKSNIGEVSAKIIGCYNTNDAKPGTPAPFKNNDMSQHCKMKLLRVALLSICWISLLPNSSCQSLAKSKPISKSVHFDKAYNTIKNMLNGKEPISFKKAVFLTENAFKNGKLSWEVFNQSIVGTASIINNQHKNSGLTKYKTSKNYAIHMYMVDTTTSANHYQRYNYDYESYNDTEAGLVSNLLTSYLGNCHSLPFLYKIFSDELGAEAYLATAPMHAYIIQPDEYGEWWNIELTSRFRYLSNRDIIESFNLVPQSKKSGLYMKPLSQNESLVLCLEDLLIYYHKLFDGKNNPVQDRFVKACFNLGLKHKPVSELLLDKFHYYKFYLDRGAKAANLNEYLDIQRHPELGKLLTVVEETSKKIQASGYKNFDPKIYKRMISSIEEKKKKYPKNK